MRQVTRILCGAMAGALVSACAHMDETPTYALGDASAQNIALQAERDVNLPNHRRVETMSGVRAGNAVEALNEGESRSFDQATASDGGKG